MQKLTLSELEARAAEVDAVAQSTPDVDAFCSSTHWVLPASAALMPAGSHWLFRGSAGFAMSVQRLHHGLRCVEPLEAGWGLACPLLGPDPGEIVAEFADLCGTRQDQWDVVLLCGIPRDTPLLDQVVRTFGARYPLRLGPTTTRYVASLAGGLDGFLSRRPRSLRKSLRKAERRASELGIRFEHHRPQTEAEAEALYDRIQRVEARSWKGRAGSGLAAPEMREFYRLMTRRLTRSGRQRTLVATREGHDVGYVLGGVLGDTYRGLQFSFDADYRDCGLGNLCQLEQIAILCEEGCRYYDLGTGLEYKQRWAETVRETVALLVLHPRAAGAAPS